MRKEGWAALAVAAVALAACGKDDPGLTQREVIRLWSDLQTEGGACDAAVQRTVAANNEVGNSRVRKAEAVQIAREAAEICESASKRVSKLKAPGGIEKPEKRNFDAVLVSCRESYEARAEAMRLTAEVHEARDQDLPTMFRLRERMDDSNAKDAACEKNFALAAEELGVPNYAGGPAPAPAPKR